MGKRSLIVYLVGYSSNYYTTGTIDNPPSVLCYFKLTVTRFTGFKLADELLFLSDYLIRSEDLDSASEELAPEMSIEFILPFGLARVGDRPYVGDLEIDLCMSYDIIFIFRYSAWMLKSCSRCSVPIFSINSSILANLSSNRPTSSLKVSPRTYISSSNYSSLQSNLNFISLRPISSPYGLYIISYFFSNLN